MELNISENAQDSFIRQQCTSPTKVISSNSFSIDPETNIGTEYSLLKEIPALNDIFDIHGIVGEGTFSKVHIGNLKNSDDKRKLYAIKYLIPTCLPSRIERELKIMLVLGGKNNIIPLNACLRSLNHVAFVMPYIEHAKFTDYYREMNAGETSSYIRNLLIALKQLHKMNIIHRDVKPANFLYDRINHKFYLVDFGLSHAVIDRRDNQTRGDTTISTTPLKNHCQYQKRKREQTEESNGVKKYLASIQSPTTTPQKINKENHHPLIMRNDTILFNMKSPLKFTNGNILANNSPLKFDNKSSSLLKNSPGEFKSPKSFIYHLQNNSNILKSSTPSTSSSIQDKNSSLIRNFNKSPFRGDAFAQFLQNGQIKTPYKSPTATTIHLFSPNHFKWPILNNPNGAIKQSSITRKLSFNDHTDKTSKGNIMEMGKVNSTNHHRHGGQCKCFGKAQTCNKCSTKPNQQAPRAGTPGYRPPEVLLKYNYQTTAIDIWAVGIILLSILSGCYPFFHAPDDITALAEIITIFGTDRIIKLAKLLGQRLIVSEKLSKLDLNKLCVAIRKQLLDQTSNNHFNSKCQNCLQSNPPSLPAICLCYVDTMDSVFPECAFDLLKKLLDPNPKTRITAEEALNHTFLVQF